MTKIKSSRDGNWLTRKRVGTHWYRRDSVAESRSQQYLGDVYVSQFISGK